MTRLQKDKDLACNEIDSMKDKMDLQQGQLNKIQRDRELAMGEVEDLQEKYDKAATQAQRMLVRGRGETASSGRGNTYCQEPAYVT